MSIQAVGARERERERETDRWRASQLHRKSIFELSPLLSWCRGKRLHCILQTCLWQTLSSLGSLGSLGSLSSGSCHEGKRNEVRSRAQMQTETDRRTTLSHTVNQRSDTTATTAATCQTHGTLGRTAMPSGSWRVEAPTRRFKSNQMLCETLIPGQLQLTTTCRASIFHIYVYIYIIYTYIF